MITIVRVIFNDATEYTYTDVIEVEHMVSSRTYRLKLYEKEYAKTVIIPLENVAAIEEYEKRL